jgi:hypothetical protein
LEIQVHFLLSIGDSQLNGLAVGGCAVIERSFTEEVSQDGRVYIVHVEASEVMRATEEVNSRDEGTAISWCISKSRLASFELPLEMKFLG